MLKTRAFCARRTHGDVRAATAVEAAEREQRLLRARAPVPRVRLRRLPSHQRHGHALPRCAAAAARSDRPRHVVSSRPFRNGEQMNKLNSRDDGVDEGSLLGEGT